MGYSYASGATRENYKDPPWRCGSAVRNNSGGRGPPTPTHNHNITIGATPTTFAPGRGVRRRDLSPGRVFPQVCSLKEPQPTLSPHILGRLYIDCFTSILFFGIVSSHHVFGVYNNQ